MTTKTFSSLGLPLLAAGAACSPVAAASTLPAQQDALVVRQAIIDGGAACGRGDIATVMRTVDRELVLSFPGAPDLGYAALEGSYRRLCAGKGEGTVETTTPDFEEVVVTGDVAIARMIWSTHLRGMPEGKVRKLRDVQLWLRRPEGWRFWRGVHWPYSDDKPK